MLKIFLAFFNFIYELIFDSKEETTFKNKKFDARKTTIFVMIILSIILNMLFMQRLYKLASMNIELKQQVINLEKSCKVPFDEGKKN